MNFGATNALPPGLSMALSKGLPALPPGVSSKDQGGRPSGKPENGAPDKVAQPAQQGQGTERASKRPTDDGAAAETAGEKRARRPGSPQPRDPAFQSDETSADRIDGLRTPGQGKGLALGLDRDRSGDETAPVAEAARRVAFAPRKEKTEDVDALAQARAFAEAQKDRDAIEAIIDRVKMGSKPPEPAEAVQAAQQGYADARATIADPEPSEVVRAA